ncbi:MAG: SDR family oxidoreductase [Xanthomonadales bacterium]|nr:SDR family oxidoreductase [Xanthomonadales bacterium]
MTRTLIIGGNRGIGLALAAEHLRRGHHVIVTCRQRTAELDALGVEVVEGVEVTDSNSLQRAEQSVSPGNIDRLIVNAGVLETERFDALDEHAFANIEKQFNVNAIGPLRAVHAFQARLQPGSRVGILTSRMGSMADNGSGGYYGYRMSKAAVNAAGKSLANDLRPRGVAVALLHPGFVRTGMTGGQGDVDPAQAAAGLSDRLDALSLESSGRFWHANGSELPW